MIEDTIVLSKSIIGGEVKIPTSKSLAHRAILCALLADGVSEIHDVSMSEDIKASIRAAKALGAEVEVVGDVLYVRGAQDRIAQETTIDCNESGSTIRFLLPILSLYPEEFHVKGKKSLIQRPQTVYETIFQNQTFEHREEEIIFQASLTPGTYEIRGDISSQFVTGLLFALPLLNEDSELYFTTPLESKDYVKLTLDVFQDFGVIINETENGYHIPGRQQFQSTNYRVEGDYSQAAFWLVNGAINSKTTLTNMNLSSHQGDKLVLEKLKEMNATIQFEHGITVEPSTLKPISIDVSDIPDCGPILALLATQVPGKTTLKNIERLRIKESDRVASTVETLSKLGAKITASEKEMVITGPTALKGNVILNSYNDHRIAMMIAIAAGITEGDITLTRATAVNKSYPTFFEEYLQRGGSYRKKD